jgi:hypothetical protein
MQIGAVLVVFVFFLLAPAVPASAEDGTFRSLAGTNPGQLGPQAASMLSNGVPYEFSYPPVSTSALIVGLPYISVPDTATDLEVVLQVFTANADVRFYSRYNQDLDLTPEGTVNYDWREAMPGLTPQTLTLKIAKTSPVPLRGGNYYFAVGIFTSGVAISGRLTATYATPGASCTYTLSEGPFTTTAHFEAFGGVGTANMTTGGTCSWSASTTAGWLTITSGGSGTGSGVIHYRVDANAGGRRQAAIASQGQTFTVTQEESATLARDDGLLLPHIVNGGGWKTTVFLSNVSDASESFTLRFANPAGSPWSVALGDGSAASAFSESLLPGQTIVYETNGFGVLQQGSAMLLPGAFGSSRISGFAVFRAAGAPELEAAVPLTDRQTRQVVMLYDNHSGFVSGVALANPRSTTLTVTAKIRDEAGDLLTTQTISLPPRGHMAFQVPQRFPSTANRRGSILLITNDGAVSTLGLRFNPSGAFTSFQSLTAPDISKF